jgi:hypothetical protein
MAIWYFMVILVYFPRFGLSCQEKSGNPASAGELLNDEIPDLPATAEEISSHLAEKLDAAAQSDASVKAVGFKAFPEQLKVREQKQYRFISSVVLRCREHYVHVYLCTYICKLLSFLSLIF